MTELVSIRDCPPGLFRFGKILGFKTEYCGMETVGPIEIPGDQVRWTVGNHSDVYVVESGETFWAGAADRAARDELMVEPIDLLLPEPFLSQLRRVNLERYEAWVGGDDAGIMFDAVELGGEVGELLNIVKKLEREERGWRGSRADPAEFPNECADVLICLDKLARRRNVDLAAATIAKFNATSAKVGLPHQLAEISDHGGVAASAAIALMYLQTGFIECPQCGEEVPTKDLDAAHELASAVQPAGEVADAVDVSDAGDMDAIMRAVYDEHPFTVISEAIAKATGLPMRSAIPYDQFLATGGDDTGTRRIVLAALTARAALARAKRG